MKIAIISDTHDNLPNIIKAMQIINQEKVKTLLHCGDICSPSTLKVILDKFKGKIHVVLSNIDGDYFRTARMLFEGSKRLKIWGEVAELKLSNKRIAFLHSPQLAKSFATTKKYDIVFYGHTHKPWEEKVNNTRLVNPGTLAGIYYKATFAVYDTITDKLELRILELYEEKKSKKVN